MCSRPLPLTALLHAEVNTEPLAWLPLTAPALTWRLLCLDAAVCYGTGAESRPWRERLVEYRYVQLPLLLQAQPTGDSGCIHTVAGIPTYTSTGLFPTLPLTAAPMDALELSFDAQALLNADEDELRSHVPAGALLLHCRTPVLRCSHASACWLRAPLPLAAVRHTLLRCRVEAVQAAGGAGGDEKVAAEEKGEEAVGR
jgi:hypothetical protein